MEIIFENLGELKSNLEKAIAQNGYFCKSDKQFKMREQIILSFQLKGKTHRLDLRSEVVFMGGGGIGVIFSEGGETIKARFNQFLDLVSGTQPQTPKPPQTDQQPAKEETPPVAPSVEPDIEEIQEEEPPEAADAQIQKPAEPMPQGHIIKGKMRNVLKIETSKGVADKDRMGDFGDLSFTKILINIFEGKSTGIAKFKNQEVEKIVYFRNGRPVFVESNPPLAEESIGNILLAKGKIKKEDLDRAIKYVEEHGVRLGEAMMALKAVSPTLLKDALTFQLKVKLYELFKWKESDFEMQLMPTLSQKFGTRPINIINVIYKGLKEKLKDLYPADLEQYISPIYDKYLVNKESKLFDLENLGFNNQEKRFWQLMLNGRRRVREIFAGSTMNRPDTFRFLYALLELDMLTINDRATLDIPNIERDLYNQARFMEKMDYFEVLAIHWSVNKEKLEIAYKNKTEEFSEKKKIPNLGQETLSNIDKILNLIKRAYEELLDPAKRREYRKAILGESESKVAAELAARQAQLMEFRNDMKEARNLIEIAIDLDPTNSEYRTLFSKYGGKRQ